MSKKFKNKGITLIALVITIIVLLILAGISISMLSGDNSILSRATEAKTKTEEKSKEEQIQIEVLGSFGTDGNINVATLKTNLGKIGATATGNNLPLTVTLGGQEFTIDTNGDVTRVGDVPVSNYGYNSAGNCFIGQKSIGKWNEGEEDNTQKANWDSSENGYKFTSGHFARITNYSGYLWDETAGDFVEKTGADVYLCWDGNYGTINSKQDLIDYANNNGVSVYWDIFDASSGAWLFPSHSKWSSE